jgi:hypothetical protein
MATLALHARGKKCLVKNLVGRTLTLRRQNNGIFSTFRYILALFAILKNCI